jgi:acetyl esterase
MPVDPQCAAILEVIAAKGSPFEGDDHLGARAAYAATTKVYRHDVAGIGEITNRTIAGPGGVLPLRIYRPDALVDGTVGGALVFFHGGGWVIGDLDTHDHLCRYLGAKAGCVVVSVDYRLAPEHKFPAALEDCVAAVRWVAENAGDLGIDPARLAIGGDSAGGNLAAAAAIELRDHGGPKPVLQLLMYPAVDFTADNDSLHENAEGYILTRTAIEKFADWYLPDRAARSDPRASPQLAAHHTDLPRAWVQTAEFDPLRDEGQAYAQTLAKHGVQVEYKCYAGMVHGFMRMGGRIDKAFEAMDDAVRALKSALG